jgi:hypothetical protein
VKDVGIKTIWNSKLVEYTINKIVLSSVIFLNSDKIQKERKKKTQQRIGDN